MLATGSCYTIHLLTFDKKRKISPGRETPSAEAYDLITSLRQSDHNSESGHRGQPSHLQGSAEFSESDDFNAEMPGENNSKQYSDLGSIFNPNSLAEREQLDQEHEQETRPVHD